MILFMGGINLFYRQLKKWFTRYEQHISGAALLFGFAVDNFTLTRIDLWLDNLILFIYLLIALFGIVLVNLYEGGVAQNAFFGYIRRWSPLAVQFAFGGLFSGFVVFYSRSATLATSWPFILLLAALFVGNEFFRSRYSKLTFQMSIFFIALFSFLIFYTPVIVGMMGAWVFLLSGIMSIAIISLFIRILLRFIPERVEQSKKSIICSIGIIFIAVNILYFTNIIPPIPLSLKDASVYHYVEKAQDGNYLVQHEQSRWYDFLIPNETIHITENEPLYMFSSVFAPTKLNTQIFHKWQFYDEKEDEWITENQLGFSIVGGRDGGYRGYTMKANVTEGAWRVDVVTERDQLIGRIKFKVKKVNQSTILQSDTR
jgi:hypothetical protein